MWTAGVTGGSDQSLSVPCRYSSKRQQRRPQVTRAMFWRLQEQPLGHKAPAVLVQLPGLKHVGPCHIPGRASGPDCFPFGKK